MNYGDALISIAQTIPDQPALIHGEHTSTWAEFDSRSNKLANHLAAAGLEHGDKVAFYLLNSNVYSELLSACFKAGYVHVNVNYRYVADELRYILDNSDSRVVCYHARFASGVAELREHLPQVRLWLEVTEELGTPPINDFATNYETVVDADEDSTLNPSFKRSGEDLLFIYTGGTTGLPKGVMWEHKTMWEASLASIYQGSVKNTAQLQEVIASAPFRHVFIPACPQMHGTGMITTINALVQGACVVTLDTPKFDAHALWSAVETHKVTQISIVGDAFSNPMGDALRAQNYDISSMHSIVSSGIMWSPKNKQILLQFNENMSLVDTFGSSEAIGFGTSVSTKDETPKIASFAIGPTCKVFTKDLQEVLPGSDEVGFIARSGPIPLGYYGDQKKTDETFISIDGTRYSMPGDWCRVAEDGTLILLGRGSVCINSGGEKIYPEEVEEALKSHADVLDALVVGVPSERWGQAVTALVELQEDGKFSGEQELIAHVREQIAPYKCPKTVIVVPTMFRAPNGKADYKRAKDHAFKVLDIET